MGYFEIGALTLLAILIIIEFIKVFKQYSNKNTIEELNKAKAELLETKNAVEIKFKLWKEEHEKAIRKDSVTKSKDITRGYIIQNLLPLLKVDLTQLSEDPINFNDFQAMGSPIDYIYFKGLSDGNLEEIKFIEVKSQRVTKNGRTSISLPKREKQIRDIIKEGKVSWELIQIEIDDNPEKEVIDITDTQPN